LKYGYFILLEADARVERIIVSVDKGRPNWYGQGQESYLLSFWYLCC